METTLATTKSGARIEPYDVVRVAYLHDVNGRETTPEWLDYATIRTEQDARDAIRLVESPDRYKRFQIVRPGGRGRIIYC